MTTQIFNTKSKVKPSNRLTNKQVNIPKGGNNYKYPKTNIRKENSALMNKLTFV